MTDTTYVDFQGPVIAATWLNDVNNTVYKALGAAGVAPATSAAVINNLALMVTNALNTMGQAGDQFVISSDVSKLRTGSAGGILSGSLFTLVGTQVMSYISHNVPITVAGTVGTIGVADDTDYAILITIDELGVYKVWASPLTVGGIQVAFGATPVYTLDMKVGDLTLLRNMVVGGTLAIMGLATLQSASITTTLGVTGNTSLSTASLSGLLTLTGGQIKFPAVQVPSADANTLDDYEEGTWTPVIGGTATYTNQFGTYTKIGRVVNYACRLTVLVLGTGSASTITGLPFTSLTTPSLATPASTIWGAAATFYTELVAQVPANTVTITFMGAAAATATLTAASPIASSADIQISGKYLTT